MSRTTSAMLAAFAAVMLAPATSTAQPGATRSADALETGDSLPNDFYDRARDPFSYDPLKGPDGTMDDDNGGPNVPDTRPTR